MSVAAEVHAEYGPGRREPETASAEAAAPELAGSMFGGVLSGFGTDAGENPGRPSIASSAVMRHRASGEMRALAMRRIQAGAGNLRAQQVVAQFRRAPI